MAEFRNLAGTLAVAGLAATAGGFSTAHAQASGTLQASVTVLDDLVSRVVAAQLEAESGRRDAKLRQLLPLEAYPGAGVAASLVELDAEGPDRRLRIEIVYLH
jgi:hypothetical protein